MRKKTGKTIYAWLPPLGNVLQRVVRRWRQGLPIVLTCAVLCAAPLRPQGNSLRIAEDSGLAEASSVEVDQVVATEENTKTKPNFSGTWRSRVLNPIFAEMDWIDHKEPMLKIMCHAHLQDVLFTETYTTGAKDPNNTAHWEERELVLKGIIPVNGLRKRGQMTLSLSADGKVMTKTIRLAGREKGFDQMDVYDKISDRGGP